MCQLGFANEISKRGLKSAFLTEQIERQVLFCTVTSLWFTVAAWRRETTRDVGAAL